MVDSIKYANEHNNDFLEDLKDFLRIPSVSTDPQYTENMQQCAKWLKNHIKRMGIENSNIIETDGHPIVYAEGNIDASKPTVLVYGHYDVQPADPVSEWDSAPFEPTIRENNIYARGACDDKGQVFAVLKALESILNTGSELKYNIKLLFEGEEEVGSSNIIQAIKKQPDKFSADAVLICDSSMFSEKSPAICVSVRGIVYTELILDCFAHDLHSGVYGGAVENPIHILSNLISGFHDENHRITVKGFYDDVAELDKKEEKEIKAIPFNDSEFLNEIGITESKTEKGFSIYEAKTIRPTLDVNGIWGGYSGEGAKTVIPSRVGAKISCRLVANQNPKKIFQLLKNHIEDNLPKSVKKSFKLIATAEAVVLDYEQPIFQSFAKALEDTFQNKTYYVRGDGSLPIVAEFKNSISPNVIVTGFGLNSDSIHSPNEKFGLNRFAKGIETLIRFFLSD